jgi:hypothetical protein
LEKFVGDRFAIKILKVGIYNGVSRMLYACDSGEEKISVQKEKMKAVKAKDDEKRILLSHENSMISHDRLKYIVFR